MVNHGAQESPAVAGFHKLSWAKNLLPALWFRGSSLAGLLSLRPLLQLKLGSASGSSGADRDRSWWEWKEAAAAAVQRMGVEERGGDGNGNSCGPFYRGLKHQCQSNPAEMEVNQEKPGLTHETLHHQNVAFNHQTWRIQSM